MKFGDFKKDNVLSINWIYGFRIYVSAKNHIFLIPMLFKGNRILESSKYDEWFIIRYRFNFPLYQVFITNIPIDMESSDTSEVRIDNNNIS